MAVEQVRATFLDGAREFQATNEKRSNFERNFCLRKFESCVFIYIVVVNNYLLTEGEVFTVKYETEALIVLTG